MYKVKVRQMSMKEYLALGFTHVENEGVKYQIITPNETEAEVDGITVGSGFRFWGLKRGKSKNLAIPIYPPVPTNSERIENGEDVY